MSTPGGGTDKSAKHMFDRIGQQVHDEVKNGEAQTYKQALTGQLSFATASGETVGTNKPCDFGYDKLISGSGRVAARGDPCKKDGTGNDVDRFSVKQQAEYDNKKMKCSYGKNDKNEGACAPYRRLSLCNKNMVKMDTNNDSKAKHDLLADVCLAAKHEGNSINTHYKKYQAQYASSASRSQICTMLARSFADIGDIVRGRDLYLGDNRKDREQRKKLEKNLKEIFGDIYKELKKDRNLKEGAEKRYNDTTDYFQLREDWWTANRATVWKALTCNAWGDTYFHATCSDSHRKESCCEANDYCRCNDDKPGEDNPNTDPPTYFDYVPQYLRWFEEWAEDFCRKKNKKVENAKKQCRGDGEDGKKRYCSGNGYDCTKTVRAQEEYSMENNCHKCFFACNPFVKWLDNQKVEFDKQKEKYKSEIKKGEATNEISNEKINNVYEKEFYKKLQEKYGDVKNFLELLNKETTCKGHPKVEGEDYFDFTKLELNEIFSLTEYCEPCPICGGSFEGGQFVSKGDEEGECPDLFRRYEPPEDVDPTEINVLQKEKEGKDILQKLQNFCNNKDNKSNIKNEKWKCYHKESNNDKCVLEYYEKGNKKKKVKKFYDFFRFWVTHMLDDSMEWKEKLNKCLKNKKICKNKQCKKNCECYDNWVDKKTTEWGEIKTHFHKQTGFGEGAEKLPHYIILELFLENEYFDGISNAYNDPEHMEKIKKKLEEKKKERVLGASDEETIIDYLLEHEGEEAKKCKNCQPPGPAGAPGAGARSLVTKPDHAE
ncbi:hypothetical protein PFTANZ_06536, partial [Plasmodium falciparum Tanzania (2000708)]